MTILRSLRRLDAAIAKGRRRIVDIPMAHSPTPPKQAPGRDAKWKEAKRRLQAAGLGVKIRSWGEGGPKLQGVKHRKLGRIDYDWGTQRGGIQHIAAKHGRADAPDLSRLPRMRPRKKTAADYTLRNKRDTAIVARVRAHRRKFLITAFRRLRREERD